MSDNSRREIIAELIQTIDNDTGFSSDLSVITRHPDFTVIVELYGSGTTGHESAIRYLIEQLEHHLWIAAFMLQALVETPVKIPAEHADNLHRIAETWILWALQHGYGTEQSQLFLALVRIHLQVIERFERIFTAWQRDKATISWDALVKLGKQYPSVVYPIVITKWALPKLSNEEGYMLMAAISGVDNPSENLRYAPAGVELHTYDPNDSFSSWYEWLRRWTPVVAPYRLWHEP